MIKHIIYFQAKFHYYLSCKGQSVLIVSNQLMVLLLCCSLIFSIGNTMFTRQHVLFVIKETVQLAIFILTHFRCLCFNQTWHITHLQNNGQWNLTKVEELPENKQSTLPAQSETVDRTKAHDAEAESSDEDSEDDFMTFPRNAFIKEVELKDLYSSSERIQKKIC